MTLTFTNGPMGSSKTLLLLTKCYNLKKNNKQNVILMKPLIDTRHNDLIKSRTGLEQKSDILVDTDQNIIHLVENYIHKTFNNITHYTILVDESQFLSREHVSQLRRLAHSNDIFCYGLLTDYTGRLFEGSSTLIEMSDIIRFVEVECYFCGKSAKCNAKYENQSGDLIKELGTNKNTFDIGGDEKYISCCWDCWSSKQNISERC